MTSSGRSACQCTLTLCPGATTLATGSPMGRAASGTTLLVAYAVRVWRTSFSALVPVLVNVVVTVE